MPHYRRLGRVQQAVIAERFARIRELDVQIASAADDQSTLTPDVCRNVVNIDQPAERAATHVENTTAVSGTLPQLSDRLESLVKRFRSP